MGEWALPGGKLQWGESLHQAVEREIREECGICVRAGEQLFTFEEIVRSSNGDIDFHYVVIDFWAEYLQGEPKAGDDADDAAWIDWDELNSLTINQTTLQLLQREFPERF